jgi:transposase-like protein
VAVRRAGAEAAGMGKPDERGELIRAVQQRGEAVTAAAARLGVSMSMAYRWIRVAASRAPPTFVELVAERSARSTIQIHVRAAEIEVRAGFDARLLREVVESES